MKLNLISCLFVLDSEKSDNFRKKIIKYCEKVDNIEKSSQRYRFKPLKGDIWI